MARSFNYSKWDNIELSDDESDLHPNIDKDSWFRMKHRSRLEREEKEDVDINTWTKLNEQEGNRVQTITARLAGLAELIAAGDEEAELEDQEALQGELRDLTGQIAARNKKIAEIQERRSWNIDNICHVADEKTIVNSAEISSLKAKDFAPTGQTEAAMHKNKNTAEAETEEEGEKQKQKAEKLKEAPASSSSSVTSALQSSSLSAPALPAPSTSSTSTVATVSRSDPAEKRSAISYNDYVLQHEDLLETYSELPTLEKSKDFLVKHGGVSQ
jgi:hypothetical protein